jgi:hypothetical protein
MKIMGIRKVIHKYVKEKISYQSDRTGTDMWLYPLKIRQLGTL